MLLAFVGYLFALGGLPSGQGWYLLAHLVLNSHADSHDHMPHAHDGKVHTHESEPTEVPLFVIVILDDHVSSNGTEAVGPPRARDLDFLYRAVDFSDVSPPVETPPPRRSA